MTVAAKGLKGRELAAQARALADTWDQMADALDADADRISDSDRVQAAKQVGRAAALRATAGMLRSRMTECGR